MGSRSSGQDTDDWLIDWGLMGTFSTNWLYHSFKKYVADKKCEINEKVDNVRCWKYTATLL